VETDPTRMCELLVGLPAVDVLGVYDEHEDAVVVDIEARVSPPCCGACGTPEWVRPTEARQVHQHHRRLVLHRGWSGTTSVALPQ
jgi:hypothetical protein